MNKMSRLILFIFILCLILFLGLIFSAWVVPNIVRPAAETIWLFLRVFILSVDQVYFWNLLLLAILIWTIYRLTHKKSPKVAQGGPIRNEPIKSLSSWRESIVYSKQYGSDRSIFRNKVLQLVISHYAANLHSLDRMEIGQGLEQRRLSLPDSVYNFLFPSASQSSKDTSLRTLFNAFRVWYHRTARQEEASFNRMIDELIEFMKS